jgi:hypothetical protein
MNRKQGYISSDKQNYFDIKYYSTPLEKRISNISINTHKGVTWTLETLL